MAHPEVKETFDRLWSLHAVKDADYAGQEGPLSNFRQCERFGVPAWKGALVRMSDKWSRLVSVMEKGGPNVKAESIDDTLDDLAVYAVIVRVLRKEAGL